jgi:hypothetical protein
MQTPQTKLNALAETLKAEFPGVTFGYLGNCGSDCRGQFDERTWTIFLPHPGRIGTYEDRVGSYSTEQLPEMLTDWPRLRAAVQKKMLAGGTVECHSKSAV